MRFSFAEPGGRRALAEMLTRNGQIMPALYRPGSGVETAVSTCGHVIFGTPGKRVRTVINSGADFPKFVNHRCDLAGLKEIATGGEGQI